MSKAWYYNTTGLGDKWYIRIYEIDYLGKTPVDNWPIIRFKKRIIDGFETHLIEIGSGLSPQPSVVYHKKLDAAKAVISDMFELSSIHAKWIL